MAARQNVIALSLSSEGKRCKLMLWGSGRLVRAEAEWTQPLYFFVRRVKLYPAARLTKSRATTRRP